ncbi:MAG: chorismate synthase [Endomicrobiia bacterium]
MIKFFTAGESHNKAILAFIEGIPAGVKISEEKIKKELHRRKKGYGRGSRQNFEEDRFEIISGVRYSQTIGSPIGILIYNNDYRKEDFVGEKIKDILSKPRPGHADLSGCLKFLTEDIKNIAERASARETAARVAAGSICKQFLENFGIFIGSFVVKIYRIELTRNYINFKDKELKKLHCLAENSSIRFPEKNKEKQILKLIDETKEKKDTLGGDFVVFALGVPVGLGSHIQWDKRLNARISYYLMSIPALKSIEIGLGKNYSDYYGSQVHDEIFYSTKKGFFRRTNHAGGIEGGISNGMPIIIRCTMKPIPTLMAPLNTVELKTKKKCKAEIIRSDIVAVPSCSVIAEAMLAICLAEEFLEKFGGDSLKETIINFNNFCKLISKL